MSRTSKGARLVWRDESRKQDGALRSRAGWFIRDGGTFISACGGTGNRERAEKRLASYITEKYQPVRQRGRDPATVAIVDAVSVYLTDVAPCHAKPKQTSGRMVAVMNWFGDMMIGDIHGKICRDYAKAHGGGAAARRQLEDLRAALNHYHREGYVTSTPAIVLPPKSAPRDRWLTRDEAAALLRAAWRMRQSWKGQPSDRRTGRHVARFILVALYTGTRSAAICGAAVRPTDGVGHVDLERGVFYRRAAGRLETKKRQPPVRLPDRLLAHIGRWAVTPLEIKTKGRGKSANIGRMIAHDYVVEWNGKPIQSIRKAFRSVVEAAGLGWYKDVLAPDGSIKREFRTDVTLHIFRHTAATWLMQQGSDPWAAAGFLGMTVDMLIQTYGHHHPDFQAEATRAIVSKARSRNLPAHDRAKSLRTIK
ncbi:site-specific integrase [Mesorhizobium sp. M1C.F.Ca.ET.193.01.1.1]|nr:site-specific integrase [Mesorhizobium sp. M1C.F.Ca.ET.210.01.1.1]TGQ68898.1 site-specific integrase [Mesorhizobium sp. M1C.F.Ca.ET.212.01.1.1]TGR04250.1 site-specific integrase [Mesorhizobium sp. M1C.F.Ca.ET.204.01.1.1]TGR24915.1 site-specific integrase [Mesorhizobium sp. M1C.F.Ca.ET.196.01.1.1]TGR47674.1 site-specific integrase [Mesorhizobium sp. M1C.F.Ca.ET.195.01.1.1]TGR63337.1 site-specific integrase [Mesorhizobium sp. M1C.F.Ca.ET.192.01.1.1]TGR77304.1 site-specific integrase [Mesorhi